MDKQRLADEFRRKQLIKLVARISQRRAKKRQEAERNKGNSIGDPKASVNGSEKGKHNSDAQ